MATQRQNGIPLHGLPPAVRNALESLTSQERKFVIAYCTGARGNGTLAAQMAGIGRTWSSNGALASALTTRSDIRAAIDAWMEAYAMNAAELTWRIADMAQCNIGPFTEWDPKTKKVRVHVPSHEVWESHKHWVKSIEVDKDGYLTHVEVHDPMPAKTLLSKIRKLHSDSPIVALQFWTAKLSDEEVLEQMRELNGVQDDRTLPPGPPVQVVDVPQEKKKA